MEVCSAGTPPGTTVEAEGPDATTTAVTKDSTGLTSRETYRIVHGVLMLVSWGLLIPAAIGEAARKYGDNWCGSDPLLNHDCM